MMALVREAERASSTAVRVYLHPGQLFASAGAATVTTVLGSCVAACLFDPKTRLGGMNHYLMPHWAGDGESSLRFGTVAMSALLERLLALGARREELRAKVFGGASVLGGASAKPGHLGEQNVDRALAFLRDAGVDLIARDTGGQHGRKLVFNTDGGAAWVKAL
jgi:chemotaxis protein CheD